MVAMAEPYASEFCRLVRLGAGAQDIHGGVRPVGYARRTAASDAFVAREASRVDTHRHGTCALLEAFAGRAPRVLDVGCSTGGSAVAMALSPLLAPDAVVGIDPDLLSLRAAEVRARGYGLASGRVSFKQTNSGDPLPFGSEEFDLVACVSVLEFIPTREGRRRLVAEMKRVTRPGGYVFLSTPNPLRFRDLHARRWLGDVVRRDGYPWATPPWAFRALVADYQRVPIDAWLASRALERMGLPSRALPPFLAEALAWASTWQKLLVRKPAPGHF